MVHGAQRQRTQELLVDVDVQRGFIGFRPGRIPVFHVHGNALLAPAKQIRRHLEIHPDQIGIVARYPELLRILQFAELDGTARGEPVGSVVGLAWRNLFEVGDRRRRAGQRGCAYRNRRRCPLEFLGITATDDQQLGGRVGRMGHHADRGAAGLGQAHARHRPAALHQHYGIAGGWKLPY